MTGTKNQVRGCFRGPPEPGVRVDIEAMVPKTKASDRCLGELDRTRRGVLLNFAFPIPSDAGL